MTKPKRKPTITPLVKPRRLLPEGWTLGTLGQWLPLGTAVIGGVVWITHLQDDVQALKAGASQADIVALKDQINEVAKDEGKLEIREGNDMAEAKANDVAIWAYVGRGKEGSPKQ